VFIIANWKRALDNVFFFRYPHISFISLIHNPLILRSVLFFSRALYNLSHLYYPLYHFRDVFLCFQILFAMDIENDQIINSAEADAAVDTTYVHVVV
jgi:hypothetical protein